MKVRSVIFAPIPDDDGFQLMHCYNCDEYFLVNPNDLDKNHLFCCPYCSLIGGIMSFTTTLRNKYTEGTPLYTPVENYKINDDSFVSENWIKQQQELKNEDVNFKEVLKELKFDLEINNEKPEIISYKIEDVYYNPVFSFFEFICCEKSIKVPLENIDKTHRCPFCFSEIIR